MPSIWEKYQKIKEMDSNSKIKTYIAKIEPIIKEIMPEDEKDYYRMKGRLEIIEKKYNIIEIIEEKDKFYIVINRDDELISKIDKLLLTDEFIIQKEGKILGHGNPITKNEILNLLKMEQSMCRIAFERIEDDKLKRGYGSGFFCEIEGNFPIKYALFTSNHILNESNLEIDKIIKFKYFQTKFLSNSNNIVEKSIKLTSNRKFYTNEKYDYTCIEIFESDGINNFFKIEPHILSNQSKNGKIFKENDIFILQFLNENEISFSDGNLMHIKDNLIYHGASTEEGSSGSPIIKRDNNNNYIIGIHKATIKDGNKLLYNLGITFDSILENIKEQINEINCIYIPDNDEKEIYLIHDYNISEFSNEENRKMYLEAKDLNKNIFENNIELYVNDKKIKFNYKYKCNDSKEIKVKFKFNKIITNMSYMFYGCFSLKQIDLSSFNTNKVTNMKVMFNDCLSLENINLSSFNTISVNNLSGMFNKCSSLKSLDLSSFNTINVNNMSGMFNKCLSLENINLSSFNTNNVYDMSLMFNGCSSLKSLDLSSFDTNKVINMKAMFQNCSSLKNIDLLSLNTKNVNNMSLLFYGCSSLENIDLSSFDTNKVNNMKAMLQNCSSLKNIDLSSFNTTKVTDMSYMFNYCSSLKIIDLTSFNTNKVNNMKAMFNKCSSLESIDLSSFNTNNVNDMSGMFNECNSLKSLDLSSFNINNVNNMSFMFNGCFSLKSLNLSSFNTNNVNNLKLIFENCFLKAENIIITNEKDKIIENL